MSENVLSNFICVAFLLFIPVFLILYYSLKLGISPMPTSRKVKQALPDLLPTLSTGRVLELGAGFGTIAHLLAKYYPHLKVEAYELSFIPFLVLSLRKRLFCLHNLEVKRVNFFQANLSGASLIFTYLFPKAMEEIQTKCKDLKSCTYLISSTFLLPGFSPESIWEVQDLYRTKIYKYLLK